MRRFVCIEFSADRSDNRPLLSSGEFGVEGAFSESDVATFVSIAGAQAAGMRATNRRPQTTVEVFGNSQRVAA